MVTLYFRDGQSRFITNGTGVSVSPENPNLIMVLGDPGVVGGAPLDSLQYWVIEPDEKRK